MQTNSMHLNIYNTLTRKKETFIPIHSKKIGIYICGPTVYDYAHMGHARSAVFFDTITRYLKTCGYKINMVRNFTDIDDKLMVKAQILGTDIKSLAQKFINEWHKDMQTLNTLKPDHEPLSSDYIVPIQNFINVLIKKKYAYQSKGNVYFSAGSFSGYGRLSGRTIIDPPSMEDNTSGKKHPADFALWRNSNKSEPGWKSLWGFGRPGWHIECSAMGMEILGKQFDIHAGGQDLIFPHHENEIAQSKALTGLMPARYWIHHGMVTVKGQKMSKSQQNFTSIKNLADLYSPQALRLFLLSKHYRNPLDFTPAKIEQSTAALKKIPRLLVQLEKLAAPLQQEDFTSSSYWQKFCQAMDDDFNTPAAIAVMFQLVRELNKFLEKAGKGSLLPGEKNTLQTGPIELLKMGRDILGVI